MKITDRAVTALACPAGRKDMIVADDSLRGFRVRVQASGAKGFLYAYKVGSTSRRVPLGAFGEVTAAEARKRAERLRGDVLDGRDPWAERRDTRAETLQAEAETRRKAEADAYTVRRLLADWDRLALARKRPSYRRDVLSRLNLHLAAVMEVPAGAVTRAAPRVPSTGRRRVAPPQAAGCGNTRARCSLGASAGVRSREAILSMG